MVTTGTVRVRHAHFAGPPRTTQAHVQFHRTLKELHTTHAAHLARIDAEVLQDSDPDDELVLRTQSLVGHRLLVEIEDAIRRLTEGTYGYCEDCGIAIPRERLEAIPYTRRCVSCQRNWTR